MEKNLENIKNKFSEVVKESNAQSYVKNISKNLENLENFTSNSMQFVNSMVNFHESVNTAQPEAPLNTALEYVNSSFIKYSLEDFANDTLYKNFYYADTTKENYPEMLNLIKLNDEIKSEILIDNN